MKNVTLESKVTQCQMDELLSADRRLVEKAMDATKNSYSPYSHFSVGACIRLDDGTEIIGANQENAAFPVGLCAERTAIFAAQAQMPEKAIVAIAIAARNARDFVDDPVSPCGSCRQVILEIEQRYKRPIRILLHGKSCVYVVDGIRNLLPLCFVEEAMK